MLTLPTATELRRLLAQHESTLRVEWNPNVVRSLVGQIAQYFMDEDVTAKQSLPVIGFDTFHQSTSHGSRGDKFNKAVDEFIAACEEAIVNREKYDKALAANASLPAETINEIVMAVMREHHDWVCELQVMCELALTHRQVVDAFREALYDGYVELQSDRSIEPGGHGDSYRLTVRGKRFLRGSLMKDNDDRGTTYNTTNYEFHAPVASVGHHNTVTQNIACPPLPADIRSLLITEPRYASNLIEYERDAESGVSNPNIVGKVLAAVRVLVESGSIASDVASHGHEWIQSIMNVI